MPESLPGHREVRRLSQRRLTCPAPIGRTGFNEARSTSTSLSGPSRLPRMCETGINTRPFCKVLTSLLAPMALSTYAAGAARREA